MKLLSQLFAVLVLLTGSACLWAESINVAVASNFAKPMEQIGAAFTQQTGHKVALAFGSSGKFYAQIKQGAPFMAFFSADQSKAKLLEQQGMIVPGSRFTYALGALALWSRQTALVDPQGQILASGAYNKLALANPKLAPYGQAALEVLQNMGLEELTRSKWVLGENISQAYQFVATGNAELGFVALSQLSQRVNEPQGSIWVVPGKLYQSIRQDAVLLKAAQHSEASQQLMTFMRGNMAQTIMQDYGYQGGDNGVRP
jgi:molybdate transport system substrate-binding protein